MRRIRTMTALKSGALTAAMALGIQLSTVTVHAGTTLIVPTQYHTIQSAVDAASPGNTIMVLPGTYVEQLVIAKDLTLVGSGASATLIQAPPILALTGFVDLQGIPYTAIVHVTYGAHVSMSGLTVEGPVVGICDPLHPTHRLTRTAGIRVTRSATLDIRDSHVTHMRDNPLGLCASGVGINVGLFHTPTHQVGYATITNVAFDDYEFDGIGVETAPTTAVISDNTITGQGPSLLTDHNGIVVDGGAVVTVTNNTISGHLCNAPGFCGPDIVNQTQMSGFLSFPAGPGSVISDNNIFNNDAGISLAESVNCCTVRDNTVANNRYLGMGFFDGTYAAEDNLITGGNIGVFVGAFAANTSASLKGDQISGTSVMPIQSFACCGFTSTYAVISDDR